MEQPGPIDARRLNEVLSSNLCRRTGYTNTVKAVTAAARKMDKWTE